jgi:hypothetical protein
VPVLLYPGHPILAHESPGYLDFFGKHHRNRESVMLCDGSTLARALYEERRAHLA